MDLSCVSEILTQEVGRWGDFTVTEGGEVRQASKGVIPNTSPKKKNGNSREKIILGSEGPENRGDLCPDTKGYTGFGILKGRAGHGMMREGRGRGR